MWCPSHCDIPGNDRADELAKEATSLERQIPFNTTRSNAKRRSKRTTLRLWQQEWKATPKTGRYAIANRLAPSLNPTKHFLDLKGSREVFGRVLQCRTGHNYTGEFRKTFLPTSPDPINCICDNSTIESRSHILRECPRYDEHRNILEEVSRYITLPEILGTKPGIQALSEFIKKTGAFTRTGTPIARPNPPTIENEPDPRPNNPYPPDDNDDGG